ncbi:MAG: hypothetical protein OXI81_16615 [Paracoccaceae bacterium]|nr:hypothetical protein [Paracoccaceae bacterium]
MRPRSGLGIGHFPPIECLHREFDQEMVGNGARRRALDAPPLFGKDSDVLVQGSIE